MGRPTNAIWGHRREIDVSRSAQPLFWLHANLPGEAEGPVIWGVRSHGMQMNQRVMFFFEGGADIRELQAYWNQEAER